MTPAKSFPICISPSHHYDPRISGNIVVWYDDRNGNEDIYGFDLSTKSEFPICTDEAEQEDVTISDNVIIWVGHRNGVYIYNIYGYDLSTKTEFYITNIRPPTGPWRGPNIDGDFIVWEDDLKGYWEKYGYDIRGYNLATGTQFPICTNEAYQGWADICGNIVVWQDKRNGNSDIYGYDLSARVEFPICTELHEQAKPLVSGSRVVWLDKRHSWWEKELNYWFYGYDLSTGTEFPIIRYDAIFSMALQDFDGDTIVYYDMEGEGSWKIMGLRLP
jgi:beta propeller repeat protein